ncbi:MAG: hypothetical protein GX443_05105 [Deltaproteobacteria bacterium]|nr:hypothetical protein [Deltaproteobacteria bacterium]
MMILSRVFRQSKKVRISSLFPFLLFTGLLLCLFNGHPARAAQVTFAWDPSPSPVAGYKLYYGTTNGSYTNSSDAQANTTHALDLTAPTYYVVAKAYDSAGNESPPSNQVVAHAMTASAGLGGSISQSGTTYASEGSTRTYTITPSGGYQIAGVTVDGASVGAVSSYTFSNITGPHTISATFVAIPTVFTITASAGPNGSISPLGSVNVTAGTNQTFTITPNSGYKIASLTVDGTTVAATNSYTFSNVTAAHSISATFAPITYTISSSAGPNGSISPSGSVTVNHGASQSFTITPNSGYKIASLTVDGTTVAATNSYTFSNVTAAHSISATFALSNQPPVAKAGPDQTVVEGAEVKLVGSNSTDPENTPLTYSWVQTGGTQVVLSSSTAADPTFTAPTTGLDGTSLTFRLTVTDPEGLKSEDTCIINVTHVNQPPKANAGLSQTVREGVLVTLDGIESTDPDDGIASYSWTQILGTQVVLSQASESSVSFEAPYVSSQGEALTFELTVIDRGGLKSTATCIVNVTDSAPPVASAGKDQVVSQGESVTLDGSASYDPDGVIMTYQWVQLSGPPVTLALADGTGVRLSFNAPDLGYEDARLEFALTVTDDTGLQAVDNCSVYVKGDQGPDLMGEWVRVAYNGSILSADFKITNSGNTSSARFIASFYLSEDGSTPRTLIKRLRIGSLAAAHSVDVSVKYIARGISKKYLLAIVDFADAIVESKEDNNTVPVVIP